MHTNLQARDFLRDLYESWLNDYISVDVFAEHNGLTKPQAEALLAVAKECWETPHPDA